MGPRTTFTDGSRSDTSIAIRAGTAYKPASSVPQNIPTIITLQRMLIKLKPENSIKDNEVGIHSRNS